MEAQPVLTDEDTQKIPFDDIRDLLVEHMPPSDRLKLLTHQMENDKRFEEQCKNVREDITSLGLKPT